LNTALASGVGAISGNDTTRSDPANELSVFGFSKEKKHTSIDVLKAITVAEPLSLSLNKQSQLPLN
jgi:hypothetical protein